MVINRLMIPIKDNVPTRTFPIITVGVIFVNILIFLWQRITLTTRETEVLFSYYGLVPKEFSLAVSSRINLLPYNILTIFTSLFLHGGILHIAGNMLYLLIFGDNVEDAMGHRRFLSFYLLSGITAAFFQFFYNPSSATPMIGASGAVSGILGAYLVLFPYARIVTVLIIIIFIKVVELPAIVLLTIWFAVQIFFSSGEGVAWYAHIGGFIFGLITIKMFIPKRARR
jgi:membrane associated rhomboid family serine protease